MWVGQARILGQEIPVALVAAPNHTATTWTDVNVVISESDRSEDTSGSTPADVPMAQRVNPGPVPYPVPRVDREPMSEARSMDTDAAFGIGRGRPAQNDVCGQCFGAVILFVILSGCLFGLQGVVVSLCLALACITIAVRDGCAFSRTGQHRSLDAVVAAVTWRQVATALCLYFVTAAAMCQHHASLTSLPLLLGAGGPIHDVCRKLHCRLFDVLIFMRTSSTPPTTTTVRSRKGRFCSVRSNYESPPSISCRSTKTAVSGWMPATWSSPNYRAASVSMSTAVNVRPQHKGIVINTYINTTHNIHTHTHTHNINTIKTRSLQ